MSLLDRIRRTERNEYYERGTRLFDQGRYEEAIAAFAHARQEQGLRRDPLNERLSAFYTGEAWANLGHAALKRGSWERAEECFVQALTIHPQYADLHYNLAAARRATRHPDAARDALNNALQINPKFAKAHFLQGLIRYEQSDYAGGIRALSIALEYDPGYRTDSFTRGINYHNEQRHMAALQSFEQVSYTEVDDIMFHYRLGDDFYKRGFFTEAVSEYQKALTLNPNYADIRNHLGVAYSAMGLLEEAVREFRYALSINPQFVDALLNLGITLRDRGDHAAAQKLFTDAVKIKPDHLVAQGLLAAEQTAQCAA